MSWVNHIDTVFIAIILIVVMFYGIMNGLDMLNVWWNKRNTKYPEFIDWLAHSNASEWVFESHYIEHSSGMIIGLTEWGEEWVTVVKPDGEMIRFHDDYVYCMVETLSIDIQDHVEEVDRERNELPALLLKLEDESK